jgi:hypothetical protein
LTRWKPIELFGGRLPGTHCRDDRTKTAGRPAPKARSTCDTDLTDFEVCAVPLTVWMLWSQLHGRCAVRLSSGSGWSKTRAIFRASDECAILFPSFRGRRHTSNPQERYPYVRHFRVCR